MPMPTREAQAAWQRAYRLRKREGLSVRVVDLMNERGILERLERERYAQAALEAYRMRSAEVKR